MFDQLLKMRQFCIAMLVSHLASYHQRRGQSDEIIRPFAGALLRPDRRQRSHTSSDIFKLCFGIDLAHPIDEESSVSRVYTISRPDEADPDQSM